MNWHLFVYSFFLSYFSIIISCFIYYELIIYLYRSLSRWPLMYFRTWFHTEVNSLIFFFSFFFSLFIILFIQIDRISFYILSADFEFFLLLRSFPLRLDD